MNDPFQLVTNCTFKGKDYLAQMCVSNSKKLELIITDKHMGEDWQCEYDASYIEALTHKTGNFKQFDVFVMMLKSGLLKTSDCITLDLLSLEDLEQLRCKKFVNAHSSSRTNHSVQLNKRYLIVTYSVEFDRIHYPLPLDYCGPPDPAVLQNNIRKLESEIERLKQKNNHLSRSEIGDMKKLKEKIKNLIEENSFLTTEVLRLNKLLSKKNKPGKSNQFLVNSLKKLEEQVLYEKSNNRQEILKLKTENKQLIQQIENLKKSEKNLKAKLKNGSRYNCAREYRRASPNLSPENSLERKRNTPCENLEGQLFHHSVLSRNSSSVIKAQEVKTHKKAQNRFLSSSSSESEKEKKLHKARSREKLKNLSSPKQNLCSKSELFRKNSSERSRQSSVDSKRNQKSVIKSKCSTFREEKPENSFLPLPQSRCCTRESSLSSRGSSKQSRLSRFSNAGSGDCPASKSNRTPRSIKGNNDLRFSMSDLETRIHALQKLLSEGLNF